MKDPQRKTVQFSGEEFIKIEKIARPFWEKGLSDSPPKFAIITGGVAAGKTTIRRQKYNNAYVNIDFGEIYNAIKKVVGENDSKLTDYTALASDLILKESINEKKNIVIEVIGDNNDIITPVIDGMIKIGYKVSINFVELDPVEAYKRHLKAVKEDKDYLSAFFTQEATLSAFYHQLGLGNMPITFHEENKEAQG